MKQAKQDNTYSTAGADKRKQLYTAVLVVGAAVLAVLVVMGIVTRDQIEEFIDLLVYLVGVLGGVAGLVAATLARKNVDPPVTQTPPEQRPL